ncbi:hypothetical protein OUZ56_020175 [Daphnia magna]|uniref:Cuticle protein n=2 Tax=Daphnia magna TaxID=35525 RepID=A0ABQ9ZDR5_9CRUS|nr:hypothetical protein OUZ56_020175 [Daphnia magna]
MNSYMVSFSTSFIRTAMHQLFIVVLAFAIGVSAQLDSPYSSPSDYPAYEDEPMMPYTFGYTVKDAQTHSNFGHHETADGESVTGSYVVALPDGRTQIVSYVANENGYFADVKYEGEAIYPEHRQSSYPN